MLENVNAGDTRICAVIVVLFTENVPETGFFWKTYLNEILVQIYSFLSDFLHDSILEAISSSSMPCLH